jgi:hypothetical protein
VGSKAAVAVAVRIVTSSNTAYNFLVLQQKACNFFITNGMSTDF